VSGDRGSVRLTQFCRQGFDASADNPVAGGNVAALAALLARLKADGARLLERCERP
jgi:hypothetical protein